MAIDYSKLWKLLIDEKMRDGETRLTTPTTDDDEEEPETIINDVPKKEYV